MRRKHCATQENDDKQMADPSACTVIYIKLTSGCETLTTDYSHNWVSVLL